MKFLVKFENTCNQFLSRRFQAEVGWGLQINFNGLMLEIITPKEMEYRGTNSGALCSMSEEVK